MKEIILLGISLIIFVSYITFIIKKYGIQKSISLSYYKLPTEWKLLFLTFIWGFAFPLALLIGTTYPVLLLGISIILIVGITPNFMDYEAIKFMHLLGAFGGIIISMASIWLEFQLAYIVILTIFFAGVVYKSVKNYIWWIEILSFIVIWIVLFIKFILW